MGSGGVQWVRAEGWWSKMGVSGSPRPSPNGGPTDPFGLGPSPTETPLRNCPLLADPKPNVIPHPRPAPLGFGALLSPSGAG